MLCIERLWEETDQGALYSLCRPLLQCLLTTTRGGCFTAHDTVNDPAKRNKTKQWDTLLKLKTSQHKSIVAGFCIDVKNEAGSSRNTLNRETKYLKYVLSEAGEPALSFEQTSYWTLICLLCAHRPFGFLSLACVQSELNVNLDTRYKRRDRWLWLLSTFFL